MVTLALCVLFGAFIAGGNRVRHARRRGAGREAGAGVAHADAGRADARLRRRARRRSCAAAARARGRCLLPQTDLAILNWRREKSVFLGTNQPQEDASWIFQLRMAELERAKSGRTSEPRPWHRLAARALRLRDLGTGARAAAVGAQGRRPRAARHRVLARASAGRAGADHLTWIPIEGLLIAALGTTPGKWLFGVYLQFSISDAYARRDTQAQLERGLKRAFRVWWEGVAFGFPLLAPILVAVAYEKVTQNQETDWDFAQDVLVTHGPPGVLNAVTGVCGLAAMLWLYGVAWHQPMRPNRSVGARRSPRRCRRRSRSSGGGPDGGVDPGVTPRPPWRAMPPARRAARRRCRRRRRSIPTSPPNSPSGAQRSRVLKVEGPRMLRAGNWRRAAELCRTWTDLELAQRRRLSLPRPGAAGAGLSPGRDRRVPQGEAVRSGDRARCAIDRSQKGIVADFLNRYRR